MFNVCAEVYEKAALNLVKMLLCSPIVTYADHFFQESLIVLLSLAEISFYVPANACSSLFSCSRIVLPISVEEVRSLSFAWT